MIDDEDDGGIFDFEDSDWPLVTNAVAEKTTVAPSCFYDGQRYLFDNGKDYVPMDRRSIKAHLERASVNDPEDEICRIQVENYVRYSGPIAGKKRGVIRSNGALLLATTSPEIITAKPGTFPTIAAFLRGLIGTGDHGDRQLETFMGWLHVARTSVLAGHRRPGQALVLAGPVACGKTQLVKQIVAPCLGGRVAAPYRYLTGKTNFNGDLVGAEVLLVDDEAGSTRIESRRALGDGIKNACFTASVRIEGKHRQAFEVDPCWRIVIAVNDQPESLLVLPPLASDIADKITIFQCGHAVPENVDFEAWQSAIRTELPSFLHAVESHRIRPEIMEPRCGVKAFWNPLIVAALSELAPEAQLLQLVDALEASGGIVLPWSGSAAGLKAALIGIGAPTRHDAERLLGSWPAACGVYLSRLEGARVSKLPMRDGLQQWEIQSAA